MAWYLALAVTFATIALAELADKTQLVCISQACRHPYAPVLAGSSVALVVVSAIGVVLGSLLNVALPSDVLSVVAGALFIAFGVLMLVSWWRERGNDSGEEACEADPEGEGMSGASNWRIFGSTFGLVALAELGDKTQLAVIALSGKYGSPVAVFVGASLALVMVSTASVLAGRMIARRMSLEAVEVVAAGLFLILGLVFLLSGVPGI